MTSVWLQTKVINIPVTIRVPQNLCKAKNNVFMLVAMQVQKKRSPLKCIAPTTAHISEHFDLLLDQIWLVFRKLANKFKIKHGIACHLTLVEATRSKAIFWSLHNRDGNYQHQPLKAKPCSCNQGSQGSQNETECNSDSQNELLCHLCETGPKQYPRDPQINSFKVSTYPRYNLQQGHTQENENFIGNNFNRTNIITEIKSSETNYINHHIVSVHAISYNCFIAVFSPSFLDWQRLCTTNTCSAPPTGQITVSLIKVHLTSVTTR